MQVPVSLVYNKHAVQPKQPAALHLDAYGAYEVSPACCSSALLALSCSAHSVHNFEMPALLFACRPFFAFQPLCESTVGYGAWFESQLATLSCALSPH